MTGQEDKKEKHIKSGVRQSLLRVTLIPLVVFSVVILALSYEQFSNAIQGEVEFGLKSVAQSASYLYDLEYPGEYSYDSASGQIYKGDKQLEGMSEHLNKLKEMSGTDIAFFYQDMLILTTISDGNSSLVGTKANAVMKKEVYEGEKERFYGKTVLGNTPYFSYFCPMYDDGGKCVGMIFAGKESSYMRGVILKSILPLAFVIVILTIAIIALITWYSGSMTRDLGLVRSFLVHLEKEKLTVKLNPGVLARKDEIGRIGQSAVEMQNALVESIEKDALTKLFNRHYGEKWLNQMRLEHRVTGEHFFVAIADIDFFKKFNDKYGHDCGDLVLKEVSAILKDSIGNKGYAARWGGEEFLLIFYAKNLEEARKQVEYISYRVKHKMIDYKDKNLNVTITMGFVEGREELTSEELIKGADQALYEGKENGRDCVIYHELFGTGETKEEK